MWILIKPDIILSEKLVLDRFFIAIKTQFFLLLKTSFHIIHGFFTVKKPDIRFFKNRALFTIHIEASERISSLSISQNQSVKIRKMAGGTWHPLFLSRTARHLLGLCASEQQPLLPSLACLSSRTTALSSWTFGPLLPTPLPFLPSFFLP